MGIQQSLVSLVPFMNPKHLGSLSQLRDSNIGPGFLPFITLQHLDIFPQTPVAPV